MTSTRQGAVAALLIAGLPFLDRPTLASSAAEPSARGATPNPWVTRAVHAPRVEQRTFTSAAVRTTVSYHLYVPERYGQGADERFPVLYWLHGSGGGLEGIAPLAAYFDDAIRTGKIPPMLVVFPNGFASSMWCDAADGSVPMETLLVREIVPDVDASFRTLSTRAGRAIEGFSMGGYGAARLGLKHPEMFGAISILAGGPLDLDFQGPRARANPEERRQILATVYGGDLSVFRAESPWVAAELNAARVRGRMTVRIVVGQRDDTFALNRDFGRHLTRLGIAHTFTALPSVGHDTRAVLAALGENAWEFYRSAFAGTD